MKIKAIFEGILLGAISAILSYYALISPATITALAVRRKIPDAWFSSLITWYAAFIIIGVSIVIGGVSCWVVYKHVAESTPRSAQSE
jgi:cell division protein FtsX